MIIDKNTPTKEISYTELARRVGDCILNNNVRQQNAEMMFDWELFNGEDMYCVEQSDTHACDKDADACNHEPVEIYQDYIITQSGAEYLQHVSNEIVFYNEKLDMYVWGITHYGTSWDGVTTNIKA